MSHFKLKKRVLSSDPVEINVTPMIDMFSVLNSFLLMTAVFSATAQIKVEVPFLSSKPRQTQQELDKTPVRTVTITLYDNNIKYETSFENSHEKATKELLTNDVNGRDKLQGLLYEIRANDPKFDKVTVMTEDDTKYNDLVLLLDSIRVLSNDRKPIPFPADYKLPSGIENDALIPKIVLGNVIL